jgi:hypothetical protein
MRGICEPWVDSNLCKLKTMNNKGLIMMSLLNSRSNFVPYSFHSLISEMFWAHSVRKLDQYPLSRCTFMVLSRQISTPMSLIWLKNHLRPVYLHNWPILQLLNLSLALFQAQDKLFFGY